MRETMARYLGSRLAPPTLAGGGDFESLWLELPAGDEAVWGCEVGAGAGGGIEGPARASCIVALRLRLF